MKQMTEKEIREWVDNDDGTWEEMCVKFARHVGALKEPVVKYQYAYRQIGDTEFSKITGLMTESYFKDLSLMFDKNIYKRLDFTRTEE